MAKTILKTEGLSKNYGGIQALVDANFEIKQGEHVAIVGDNGAGKSTLMKVISGAYIPDGGTYYMHGQEVHFRSPADARNQHLEMVYQDLSLCDTVDVAKNLFLGREPVRSILGFQFLDHQRLHAEAQEILGRLHIKVPSTHVTVKNLSGGQRQAIAIGRSVSFDPKVLILDEPTAALAVKEVDEVLALIRRLKEQGVGIILISHRLSDIMEVTDRIMFMYEGRRVAERRTRETDLEEVIKLIVQA